jgi:hypothetical protein
MREPEDPIVSEIRATRRELTQRFGEDVNALCDFLAARESEHPALLTNRTPKSPESAATGKTTRSSTGG